MRPAMNGIDRLEKCLEDARYTKQHAEKTGDVDNAKYASGKVSAYRTAIEIVEECYVGTEGSQ